MNRIKINTINIESNIRNIRDEIIIREKTPALKPKHRKKFDTWIEQLDSILDQITKINEIILPLIKKDLNYSFKKKNLIVTAMFQPSLKNSFDQIKVHFKNDPSFDKFNEILDKLGTSPDTAKSLAWVGDTIIKYAILESIWRQGITPEELHNKRQSLENNENLSILCKRWKLFENRIHLGPDVPKSKDIQGTLVESIYGIIFIEKGIEGVQKAVRLIEHQ
jgi:dsRNA-specific ribonuclease